jgi:hypothetical protein
MSQSQRTRIARLEERVRCYLAEREQASDSEGDLDAIDSAIIANLTMLPLKKAA